MVLISRQSIVFKEKNNPKVRDVNKALDKVINELLEKHGKISNPDFEKELEVITGIGYKQVKNYKNHPRPDSRINGNSKILPFAMKNCQDETRLTFLVNQKKKILILGTVLIFSILSYYALFSEDNLNHEHQIDNIEKFMSDESPLAIKDGDFTPIEFHLKKEGIRVSLGSSKKSIYGQSFRCTRFLVNKEQCQTIINRGLSFAQVSLTISDKRITIIAIATNDKDISDEINDNLDSYLEHFELKNKNSSNTVYSNKNTAIEISKMDGPVFTYRAYIR